MKNELKKALIDGFKAGAMINLGVILLVDGIRKYLEKV